MRNDTSSISATSSILDSLSCNCAANTTSGNITINPASNTYSISTGSGLTWTTPTIGYPNYYDDSSFVIGNGRTTFTKFFSYLKEDELASLLRDIQERNPDENDMKEMLKEIVTKRHLSEEFIMEFIGYIDLQDTLVMHRSEIKSQEYSQLALLIESSKWEELLWDYLEERRKMNINFRL